MPEFEKAHPDIKRFRATYENYEDATATIQESQHQETYLISPCKVLTDKHHLLIKGLQNH